MHDQNKQPPITITHIASGDLWAGAEVQLYYLAKALHNKSNIKITIILLNHGLLADKLKSSNINIHIFDETKNSTITIFKKIYSLLKKIKPDIIHTHRKKENIIGGITALLLRTTKSIRTVHGAPEYTPHIWQVKKYISQSLDILAGRYLQNIIVSVSNELSVILMQRFPERKVRIVENGIDLNEVKNMSKQNISFSTDQNLKKIAIVGRLVSVKRIDIFIEIARLLTSSTTDKYAFYIFGDGPLYNEISSSISKMGLQKHVLIMGFQENIPSYLSKMDLLLITSDHEGLPMTLLEAISLHVPVISHSIGGIPKVLKNGECGILIQNQEPEEYVIAIKNILSSKERYSQISMQAYKHVQKNYSAFRTAEKYCDIYYELIKQHPENETI